MLTAAAVALIVAGGVAAVDQGIAETGQQASFSEKFNPPSSQAVTVLDQSQLDSVRYFSVQNVTVTGNTGTLMIPGEDFEWNRNNGTITTLSGGRLAGQSSANISYGYRITADNQKAVGQLAADGAEVSGILVFVVVVAAVVVSIRALGVL